MDKILCEICTMEIKCVDCVAKRNETIKQWSFLKSSTTVSRIMPAPKALIVVAIPKRVGRPPSRQPEQLLASIDSVKRSYS